eukprot:CAMPEP_0204844732 /NCGR_PEP_ID=MMETSP1347-20130617/517_1 /ASSEMBLY_ACC=CAM_ASM_000690 /TAXON_ID=215587 /ORGANISM="Aplanochytrium stocchinoi, Strain GSBS06" /LENGTH=299 /DNA_ID=CAMNT_0051984335 /DNA_START=116 /DNA_END=1015 /DNA_ORIENTATION=+
MKNIFGWKSAKGRSGNDNNGGVATEGYRTRPTGRRRVRNGNDAVDMKDFERKLEIITARIAEWPQSVDALIFLLEKLLQNPKDPKFKQVNTSKSAFKNSVGKCGHWGPDLLTLLGFQQAGDYYLLKKNFEDPVRLFMGKTSLESVKQSELYLLGKEKIAFRKAVKESIKDASNEEQRRREGFRTDVPVEPPAGAAGTTSVRVYCGDADVRRNFQSDHTLKGVIMWLGATLSSILPEKLDEGEWELVDRSYYPPKLLNVEQVKDSTLMALNIWPSGEIEIQSAGTHEKERELNGIKEKSI